MDLLVLVIVFCVIGFLVYMLTTLIPMPPHYAKAIQVVVLVILLLYLLTRLVKLPNVLQLLLLSS